MHIQKKRLPITFSLSKPGRAFIEYRMLFFKPLDRIEPLKKSISRHHPAIRDECRGFVSILFQNLRESLRFFGQNFGGIVVTRRRRFGIDAMDSWVKRSEHRSDGWLCP